MRPQRGLAAATVIIVLILAAVALVLGRRYFVAEVTLEQRESTEANLRRVSEALIQFAALNQRLPCPAAGTSATGLEDDSTGTVNCNSAAGVVPWTSLALRATDALDGWGRKISYRVYSGTTGLTQTGGASMTDCNTNAAATGSVDANGKCPSTRQTPPAAFLAGKGLSVQTDSATTGGYAFVLISHGESGAGAFTAEGGGRLPFPGSTVLEYRNTQAGTTFDNRTRSAQGIAPTDTGFFDDSVLLASITDVVNSAKLAARDWGAPPATFGAAAVAAAGGTVDYNTGRSTLNFGAFTVTAYGDTARNVAFDVATGAGIGTIGTGVNANQYVTLNRETNEGLRFQFATTGRYLGITLSRFGSESGELERASFDFTIGGSSVRVTKMSCRSGDGRVNFTLNPGGDFSEVYIEPRLTQFFNYYSNFVIADIALCPSSNPSCSAPGAIPGENCP
ncbi:MAG: hypothetical protein KIS74_11800 [Burkholderiales bacterium]|nr:hypothetical protein [Burkholderiales bacterium]